MDTAVVFGRACGAASTTFPGEKTHGKSNKTNAKAKENIQNTPSWAESPPFAAPVTPHENRTQKYDQKNLQMTPKIPPK